MIPMRTILVTGGNGFIGTHVAKRLSGKYTVRVYDIVSGNDIRDTKKLANAMRGVDVVCHLAGLASNINSFADPSETFSVNVMGTIAVVRESMQAGVSRLIYASSMMAGNHSSYYGISKLAAEQFVQASKLQVTSLRMFNVYGPGQSITNPYQGVLAIFIGNVIRGEPITIFGDGKQSRDFIYIDDVVDVWEKTITDKKTFGKIIEVGSGRATSINTLAHAVGRKNYPIIYKPARPGDMSISRAKTKTGKISLTLGLHRTMEWARSARI